MIPCNVSGPLGVLHLPRLWLKVSLEARGKLAAGYPGIGAGYDQMVIDGIGSPPMPCARSSPTPSPPTASSKRG